MVTTVVIIVPQGLRADMSNPLREYNGGEVCEQYLNYLKNEEQTFEVGSTDCHPYEEVLMLSDSHSLVPFLNLLIELSSKDSSLEPVARLMREVVYENVIHVVQEADRASRTIVIERASIGDLDRAKLFSHLISAIELQGVKALCAKDCCCEEINSIFHISSLLESGMEHLDQMRSDKLLFCLLKTDAFWSSSECIG